jgi:hypothetical protein
MAAHVFPLAHHSLAVSAQKRCKRKPGSRTLHAAVLGIQAVHA